MQRFCVQEKTQGIARRSPSDRSPRRRAGREPIGRSSISSIGVVSAKELHEARLIDQVAIDRQRTLAKAARSASIHSGCGVAAADGRSDQRGPGDLLQMAIGDLHVVVALGQHFALFGQPQACRRAIRTGATRCRGPPDRRRVPASRRGRGRTSA